MPKSENQKLKLLYILKILYENTDAEHGITTKEIIDKLSIHGISAERKSIYADIRALDDFGMEVLKTTKDGKTAYSLESKLFELPELKMLVDVVQSSKFITEKKSNELIKKIEQFASKYESNLLQRQVYVSDRVKTMNENIYYNIDGIHSAINSNKKIAFKYFKWDVDKTLKAKKNNEDYKISPWALTWDDEYYYLIAYDSKEKKEKFFRVDKMKSIQVMDEAREGKEKYKNFNLANFSRKTFGMYGGETKKVALEVSNDMIGVIFDRFGTKIPLMKTDDKKVKVIVEVSISNQFLGWIISLGNNVKIIEPDSVVKEMKELIKNLSKLYK